MVSHITFPIHLYPIQNMNDPNDGRENIINITVTKNIFLNAHSIHDGNPMMANQSSHCHSNIMENLLTSSYPRAIHT